MIELNLKQRRALDRLKEPLVERAEAMLGEVDMAWIAGKDFGHSQLRNLIAVANETESPAVVLNFVRYQIGRDGGRKPKSWAKTLRADGGERLGDRIYRELEGLGELLASEGFQRNAAGALTGEVERLARMELIRYFLGFAARYLKYLRDANRDLRRTAHG